MKDTTAGVHPDPAAARAQHDLAEIARLLPAPAEWEVPQEQFVLHREQLMRQIDADGEPSARGRWGHGPQLRTRRRLLPALLAPATALTVAGALTLAGALTAGVVLAHPGGSPSTGARAEGRAVPATTLLTQISDVAARRPVPAVRADQYVYTREKVRGADLTSGKAVLGPLQDSEKWLSQQPGPVRQEGLLRLDGQTTRLNAELGDANGTPAGITRPTYAWLASLPTDPAALLAYLEAQEPSTNDTEPDQWVFDEIGDLIGGVLPPHTAAALYRAAARIPGVSDAPGARDAIGRQGLGIAREDSTRTTRTEWVFDKTDFTYLGSRTVLTRTTSYAKSGSLMSTSAEITTGITDAPGQRPETP